MYAQFIPPATQAPHVAVSHNARAVHDAATLRFTELTRNGKPRWVVARINPTPQSGSAIIPGAVIRADTGQLAAPSGAAPVTLKQGSWNVLSEAAPMADKEGTYSWTEVLEEEKRSLSPEDFYSPFAKGGVIVFLPAGQGGGPAWFEAAHLIFDEWADRVDAAGRYVLDHAGVLDGGEPVAGQDADLRTLLSHENPLVRISAFRQLIARGYGTPEIVQRSVATGDQAAAVLTYLSITTGDDSLAAALKQFVSATADEAKLRPIALGAYAASMFRGGEESVGARAKAVLTAIAGQLGPAGRADPYLGVLLAK